MPMSVMVFWASLLALDTAAGTTRKYITARPMIRPMAILIREERPALFCSFTFKG